MSSHAFAIFREMVSVGQEVTLYLKTDGVVVAHHGDIRYISDTGVLLENSSEVSFFSNSVIENFTITRNTTEPATAYPPPQPEPELQHRQIAVQETNAQISTAADEDVVEPLPNEVVEFFQIFVEPPSVHCPNPDFMIPDLANDDRAELVRWKNRYDNAVRIHELGRVSDDVRPIARLAERLQNPALYVLGGLIAIKCQELGLAKPLLRTGLRLGNPAAAVALTWIALQEKDFPVAVAMVCRAIGIDALVFGSEETSLLNLGRMLALCVDADIPGVGDTTAAFDGTTAENIGNAVLAFALSKKYPAAAQAALTVGRVEARKLAPDAKVFHALAELPVERPIAGNEKSVTSGIGHDLRVEEYGRITAIFPDRGYGFILNEVTNEPFFFNTLHVVHPELLEDLESRLVGQKVTFVAIGASKPAHAKYQEARSIKLRPGPQVRSAFQQPAPQPRLADGERSKVVRGTDRAPLHRRLEHLPKTAGPYAQAKRLEQMDDLDAAEEHFRREIDQNGPYRQSAIKDLASLLSRRNRSDDAIELLDDHIVEFEPRRPVENMKAHFLVKAGRYQPAAELFVTLRRNTTGRDSVVLAQHAAYCFYMLSNFNEALRYLEIAGRDRPGDVNILKLIDKVREAKARGTISQADAIQLQELAGLAAPSGLSAFAEFFIEMSDFKGVDERSITRGFFDFRDFQGVERNLARFPGRQPRMKGQLLQTLAAMCVKAPHEAGDRSVHDTLRSCFLFMSEAAINDKLDNDTIRCFLAEAAYLARRQDQVTDVVRYLLSTYLSDPLPREELIELAGTRPVAMYQVVQRFERDEPGWAAFVRDFPYYAAVAEAAATPIESEARRNPALSKHFPNKHELDRLRHQEAERIQGELATLRPLVSQAITGASLQEIGATLRDAAPTTRFRLDRERLLALGRLANESSRYWVEQDYIEREAIYGRVTGGLKDLMDAIKKEPTRLSIAAVLPLSDRLLTEIISNFDLFRADANASLALTNLLENDYYIPDPDGVMTLTLLLSSDRGSTPVEGITVEAANEEGLTQLEPCHSPELLRSGDSRELQLRIRPSASQLGELAFTLRIDVIFHNRAAGKGETKTFSLPIAVGRPNAFAEIANPYSRYSGGLPVSDPNMLFGREELLGRIHTLVAESPVGQCFVLYGQKRSGKSSVLYRLKDVLTPPHIAVLITIGMMDIQEAEFNFVKLCVDEISEKVREEFNLDSQVPTDAELRSSPSRSFQSFIRRVLEDVRQAGWSDPRLILLIDEFTYLYEYIQEGVIDRSFMRQWKGLLELGLFSAVVVGQDSMPKFKQAFANEFGVTHDERITYLSIQDAVGLAEKPVLAESESRYRGGAIRRLLDLTAGSPFYMQIMCDHLVRHLNRRRRPFITEADVDQVCKELTSGVSSLPIERFDPLITAAGESVAEASRETYLRMLIGIAHASRSSVGARMEDMPQVEDRNGLLKDLREREVLAIDAAGRHAIQVGLFAEWLRVNEPLDEIS